MHQGFGLLPRQDRAAGGIATWTQTLNMKELFPSGKPLKFVDLLTYSGTNISSTEGDLNIRVGKTWTAIDNWFITWKFDLSDKIKRDFFQAVAV